MPKSLLLFCILLLWIAACRTEQPPVSKAEDMSTNHTVEFQGHRGCRGLLPENTIPGFLKALDLHVEVLEMDVVITSDSQVLVSHEPWFSHEICLDPSGKEISETEERLHNIYQMTYAETKNYDCGLKPHPRFGQQERMAASKPLLRDVIDSAEAHARTNGMAMPRYNIEIKSTPEGDGLFHPDPETFARLVEEVIHAAGVEDRTVVQSFDVRPLQVLKAAYPEQKLALLVENDLSPQKNLELLGFVPDIYSPEYVLIDSGLIAFCQKNKMRLIAWTVNDVEVMEKLVRMHVDGIISDYPDKFSLLYGKQQ